MSQIQIKKSKVRSSWDVDPNSPVIQHCVEVNKHREEIAKKAKKESEYRLKKLGEELDKKIDR